MNRRRFLKAIGILAATPLIPKFLKIKGVDEPIKPVVKPRIKWRKYSTLEHNITPLSEGEVPTLRKLDFYPVEG